MQPPIRPHAVILAGGQARRMGGGDKPLRLLAGRTLLDHVLARIAPQTAAIALSANGDPARFAAWPLEVLPDATPGRGPLSGMLAGLVWAKQHGADWLLCVPGDTPFLPPDLVPRLAAANAPIAHAAEPDRDHFAVTLLSTSLAEDLSDALAAGTRAIRQWMQGHAPARVLYADGAPFQNINTPEEHAAAQGKAKGSAPGPRQGQGTPDP